MVLACGDSGEGFKFSALMGLLLADLAEGRAPDADVASFSLARFATAGSDLVGAVGPSQGGSSGASASGVAHQLEVVLHLLGRRVERHRLRVLLRHVGVRLVAGLGILADAVYAVSSPGGVATPGCRPPPALGGRRHSSRAARIMRPYCPRRWMPAGTGAVREAVASRSCRRARRRSRRS